MPRVRLPKGKQREFLEKVKEKTTFNWDLLGQSCRICARTLRDWRREKYQMDYKSLSRLHRISKVSIPQGMEILPDYWSTKKAGSLGAKRQMELYGNPGTPEGRRKGGMTTVRRLRSDPEFAKMVGFKLRKQITYPQESPLLAEFAGILLGDGGIKGTHQVAISFNRETDNRYADYIQGIIKKLFSLSSSIYPEQSSLGADIVISSTNLVEFLAKKRILQKGNKMVNRIDIPGWIMKDEGYKISCLRGLMDTDGGIYYHKYKINHKWYKYSRLCFCSASPPLVNSVLNILKCLNFTPKLNKGKIILYRLPEIQRYFKEVGTHNPKHLERYKRLN